jgi:hypothetical protein
MAFRLLILAALLWVLWRLLTKFLRDAGARGAARREAEEEVRGPDGAAIEDLVQCAACGAYVPTRGGAGCDRPGCPKRR